MHPSLSAFVSFRWLVLLLPLLLSACATAAPSSGGQGGLSGLTTLVSGSFSRESSADALEGVSIPPGEEFVLARVEGPAVIDRLWIAIEGSNSFWRDIVLRITWDDASAPSVEAPIGDFFAVGPGARQSLNSMPMSVQSSGRSFTSLWKMPFAGSATISLVNEGGNPTRHLRYEVDYRSVAELPGDSLYFHARYVQADPPEIGQPLTVLRTSGQGQYVGMSLTVQNAEPGAWGNGRIHFEVDDGEMRGPASLALLNYFGAIFGVAERDGPFQGATLDEGDRSRARTSVYRFHIYDPVPFAKSIQVQLDHGQQNQRSDRFGAVTYWYQREPAVPFEILAGARARRWPAPTDAELALWKRADEINKEVMEAYRRNDYPQAMSLLEELLKLEPQSVYASYNLACLYALHKQADRSLHMLERAIELGFTEFSFARHDPDLVSLHESPRFRHLVGLDSEGKKDQKEP